MMNDHEPGWDGRLGTAGGAAFGAALSTFAAEQEVTHEKLSEALECAPAIVTDILEGRARVGISALARFVSALRTKPIEFLQRTGILGLAAYASGLDPLYFLPEGAIRYDARIYMREINPRHRVPESDMTKRNPTLRALADDALLDPLGKIEIELTYLLRVAVEQSGGSL